MPRLPSLCSTHRIYAMSTFHIFYPPYLCYVYLPYFLSTVSMLRLPSLYSTHRIYATSTFPIFYPPYLCYVYLPYFLPTVSMLRLPSIFSTHRIYVTSTFHIFYPPYLYYVYLPHILLSILVFHVTPTLPTSTPRYKVVTTPLLSWHSGYYCGLQITKSADQFPLLTLIYKLQMNNYLC